MAYFEPAVLSPQGTLAMSKLWHVVAGLYFWEFVTTLDYEWCVIRKRRHYRWTIWIYFTTRIATLIAITICLFGLNVTARYNCQVKVVLQFFFGYLSIAAASLLIVLRIIAIWERKKIVITIVTSVWGVNVIFLIQAIVRIRAEWVPPLGTCAAINLHSTKLNIIVTLTTEFILLLIMLVGLIRLGYHERSAFGLGRLLWRQGLISLLVATIAGVPPVVFICLNLNNALNSMFQIPSMVTLSIAATRIYRGLRDHVYGHTELLNSIQTSGCIERKANKVPFTPTSVSRVEVVINTTHEQDQTPQTNQSGSLISVEGQLCEKPIRQPGLAGDVENDGELTQVS